MTFQECLVECAMTKELVDNFNRLQGTKLNFQDKRPPIVRMIDDATGNPNIFHCDDEEIKLFITFVFEYIWFPLIPEVDSNKGEL